MKALASILFEISCTQDFQILFSKGHNSKKGHNLAIQKIRVNYFIMRNVYMKFQNPSIHRSNVSNFTEKWKNQSKFRIFVKNLTKFSKVNQVIYFSAPTSVPNMKALASILFEISCTQDFQILFSKEHNSKKGHNLAIQKIRVNYFIMRNVYMKFQNPSIHRSKVSNFTEKWKNQSKFQNPVFL